jgi:hypothetical protein
MAGIGNNLYPPIVDTFMPAFVRTQPCKIYFSLSAYNSLDDILNAQVIVNNQSTNMSALNSEGYPTGIKITNINSDSSRDSDDKYYIVINPSDLEDGFELNQFYKVQIRFTSSSATAPEDTKKIASWLTDNEKYFSEWSTVCIIKGIQQPTLYIKGFEDNTSDQTIFTTSIVDFIGQMYYSANSTIEKEYLKSYRIQIYNRDKLDTPLADSGEIFSNSYNPNEINYTLDYQLEEGISYSAYITYTTNNLYTETKVFNFIIIGYGIEKLNATMTAESDEEEGRVKIHILGKTVDRFTGNITIRRASSTSNFLIWEDIYTVAIIGSDMLDFTWYDNTVESGIWYKYCAQRRNSRGDRGSIIEIESPIMISLEYSFLSYGDKQLKLKFDNEISSFKYVIAESKTDTIGSQYSFIRRNGNMKYRQFPMTGLITRFCDENNLFATEEEVYQSNIDLYNEYNQVYKINEYNDRIYEKKFRDLVMDFLYKDNVKLFRSTTEGNILVKLMDISFTPNQTLGRMIYSFSATAYEVAEANITNYNTYNIQSSGGYDTYLQYSSSKLGQIQEVLPANKDILNIIQDKYSNSASDGFKNVVNYLSYLRVEFNSKPYLIADDPALGILPATSVQTKYANLIQGYILYINGNPIIVSDKGFYELRDEDIQITSLAVPVASDVTIDYICNLSEIENVSTLASQVYYYQKVGQCWGNFAVNESIINKIYLKYLLDYPTYYQKLISVNGVNIEADRGTVVYVKDSSDDDFYREVIGETETLQLYNDDATIEGLYFGGVHLDEYTGLDTNNMLPTQFKDTGMKVTSVDDIASPIENGVYWIASLGLEVQNYNNDTDTITINSSDVELKTAQEYMVYLQRYFDKDSNRYIYYKGQWCLFGNENDVLCSVDALVDYYCEVMKGEY